MPHPTPGASTAFPSTHRRSLRTVACILATIGTLTACQSTSRPPSTRSADTLIDTYRSTLLQCAGEPNEYRQHDGNEWMRFKECSLQLTAGHVVAQNGNCKPYIHCR